MRVTILHLTTAVALVGLTLTRTGPDRPVAAPAPATPLGPVETPQPSDRSAVGTLEQADTARQQITVATTSGRVVFHVQSNATIRQGSKTLKPSDLASHRGERVKVRYRESGGERRADWIVLAAAARRVPKGRESQG